MVDEPVRRLVSAYRLDHIQKRCILRKAPIVDSDRWGGLVRPLWDATGLDLGDAASAKIGVRNN
jgi:hypothetical protein